MPAKKPAKKPAPKAPKKAAAPAPALVPPHGALVDVPYLQAHLDHPDWRIVDLRWYLQGKDGREEYEKGHIPGAVFLDLNGDLTAPSGPGRHPVPSPEQFAEAMSAAGINDSDLVVAYDDAGGSIAARLWFLAALYGHTVHVLDGGLQAWVAAGGKLSTEVPQVKRGEYTAGSIKRSLLDKHAVERLRRQKGVVLLDARAPERYRGDLEPVDARPGHIPGAISAPWAGNLREGRFLPAKELRKRFKDLGITRDSEVIVYCGSGVTACHDLLALERAGHPRARLHLYEGSWSDWSKDSFRPVATGEE